MKGFVLFLSGKWALLHQDKRTYYIRVKNLVYLGKRIMCCVRVKGMCCIRVKGMCCIRVKMDLYHGKRGMCCVMAHVFWSEYYCESIFMHTRLVNY